MIIAAFAGTGKSMLAEKYPDKIVDFVCMPYKYYLETCCDGGEAGKANPDNIMRDDWPYNYVDAIKEALGNGLLLLIPSEFRVLSLLREENIPYFLCYPQRSAKEIYHKRYLDRGNTEEFLAVFIDKWDRFLDNLEKDSYGQHIVLQPQQFLSDVIDRVLIDNKGA